MGNKIYTKTGDKGTTGLLGGTRLPKHHIRIEAYGTVDELNSYLGLLRDLINEKQKVELIMEVQDRLFTMGSHLACDPGHESKMNLPEIYEEDIVALEKDIDSMQSQIPEMRSFVLPGGHIQVSHCHVARCICRRAERSVLRLAENEKVNEIHYKYLNRLSDWLFMLSRFLTHQLKAIETPWKPKNK